MMTSLLAPNGAPTTRGNPTADRIRGPRGLDPQSICIAYNRSRLFRGVAESVRLRRILRGGTR